MMSLRTTFARLVVTAVLPTLVAAACAKPAPRLTLHPGVITIGSDIPYAPFEEFTKVGGTTGFDVELMNAVARKLGLTPEYVDTNFTTIFSSLADHRFDVVASAVTAYAPKGSPAYPTVQQRRRMVAFSVPYYDSLQSLTVNIRRTPNVTTVNQLTGQKVAAQRNTTGEFYADQVFGKSNVVTFIKSPDMYGALEQGEVAGVINDLPVSEGAVKDKPGLKVVQQIATGEQYAFAVPKTDGRLLGRIDAALRQLMRSGTYDRIFHQYFPNQELPTYAG